MIDICERESGFAIGGAPPVEHNEKMMTFLDPALKNYEWIWAAAGTPFAIFRLSSHEIQKIFGKRSVKHVNVLPGQHVLDVATGRGAVLFPLADAVGPLRKVIRIDISQQMIAETSREVPEKGINWVKLICMDAEHLHFPDSSFDYVFCGFGLFLLPAILPHYLNSKEYLSQKSSLLFPQDAALDSLINEEIKKIVKSIA